MPSPFPGMNPWFEEPSLWPGVHGSLIDEIRAVINRLAPDRYFADIEERVYLCTVDDPFERIVVPDVVIRGEPVPSSEPSPEQATGTATLVAPVRATIVGTVEHREHRVVLRTADDEQRVVTVIEVLSPANKTPGSKGQSAYRAKRDEVLDSDCHFIEIDLLRAGIRIPAGWNRPELDYRIAVSRQEDRPMADWWFIALRQPLPTIPVPLSGDDPDLQLDLQSVLNTVYDRGGYVRRMNYSKPIPSPAVSEQDQEWLRACLS
jgi:hypothetical protein